MAVLITFYREGNRMLQRWLVAVLLSWATGASAEGLTFRFDDEQARLASQAVGSGSVEQAGARLRAAPASAAVVRKMKLADHAAMMAYYQQQAQQPTVVAQAQLVQMELARGADSKFALAAELVRQQLQVYVPPELAADLNVHFIFGSNASGFAFDDQLNDVYVNLARFTGATAQELAETVSHELFHGVQAQLMTAPPRPTAGMSQAASGPTWARRLLYDLVQEGTAELFTHPLADRPATPFSANGKARIARNGQRMRGIFKLYETTTLRLLLAPPRDEDEYERIYGVLFYGDFDDLGYDMGWIMAHTIEQADGKAAIVRLLQGEPKQFVLRYQELALGKPELPRFGDDFLRAVRSL
jgi:hypothetical protein